jgi:DNA-directed RNA polymerase-3 subunit RPC5
MTYDTSTVVQSRVRPDNQQVELSFALNTDGPNFDESKGEQMALNVDGSDSKAKTKDVEDKMFSSGVMDKQVLSSTRALKDTSRYAVGILGGNELHITPVKSVLHLRPDLKYLDKSDKTARAEGRTLEDIDDPDPVASGAGGGVGAGEEYKGVSVRFSREGVSDAAKKNRERSYEYQQKKLEEEAWRVTRFHHLKTTQWEEESQKMFCKKMDEEASAATTSTSVAGAEGSDAKEYLRKLTTTG